MFLPDSKKTIRIFGKRPDCQIRSWAEQVLYGSAAYYQSKGAIGLEISSIANFTGMTRKRLVEAAKRLETIGLINNLSVVPRPDWFVFSDKLEKRWPSGHWSLHYANWSSYVRKPGKKNPLTPQAVAVWSYLVHCHETNHKPRFTLSYLARITSLSYNTVVAALDKLQEVSLIRPWRQGKRVVPVLRTNLTADQLEWFADKLPTTAVVGVHAEEFDEPVASDKFDLALDNVIGELLRLNIEQTVITRATHCFLRRKDYDEVRSLYEEIEPLTTIDATKFVRYVEQLEVIKA